MKKYRIFALLLALLLLLTACAKPTAPVEPDQPELPPVTEPDVPAEPDIPEEPEVPEEPEQPEKPDVPEELEADHKAAYEDLLADLLPQGLDHIEMTGWGNTYLVSSEKGLKDVVYILQKLTLTEPTDAREPGAISLSLTLFTKSGNQFQVTLSAFSIVPAGQTPGAYYAYDYEGDVFAGLMDIAAYEGNEEPFVMPLEGSWYAWTEARDSTVVIDEKAENIRLVAQEDMKDVKLYRSAYGEPEKKLLHSFGDVAKGQVLDFQAETPENGPPLALEWVDTFGYTTRWQVLPLKIFTAGEEAHQVELFYDRDPISPVPLASGLNPDDVDPLGKTAPYKYMTSEAKQRCVTEVVLEYEVDLDGNGRKNTVQLLHIYDPSDTDSIPIIEPEVYDGAINDSQFAVRILCGSARYDSHRTFSYDVSLFLADMNGDDNMEIYFSGTPGSDDFTTRGFYLAPGGLEDVHFWGDLRRPMHFSEPMEGLNGQIVSIEDDLMTVRTYVHMLGSHWATQVYSADQDGALCPFPGNKWTVETPKTLKLKKDLPVTLNGKAATLAAGTELKITQLGQDRAYFTSSAGTGHIDMEYRAREDLSVLAWWWIEDIPETDYFETLPYAG